MPYTGDRYGNWRLSVLRAVSVLEVLGDHGLNLGHRQDVAPDGFGDTEPLVAYDGSSLAQPLNRRVEIVVLRENYVEQAQKRQARWGRPDGPRDGRRRRTRRPSRRAKARGLIRPRPATRAAPSRASPDCR